MRYQDIVLSHSWDAKYMCLLRKRPFFFFFFFLHFDLHWFIVFSCISSSRVSPSRLRSANNTELHSDRGSRWLLCGQQPFTDAENRSNLSRRNRIETTLKTCTDRIPKLWAKLRPIENFLIPKTVTRYFLDQESYFFRPVHFPKTLFIHRNCQIWKQLNCE